MKLTEAEIKDEITKILESDFKEIPENYRRFMEGDDLEDDSGDDDGSGDDGAGGDDMGDDMGDDGDSSEDSDGSDEEKNPNKKIDKLSDNVDMGFQAPKSLTLADGTQTHIATDSEDQIGDVDQDQENFEVNFEKGNWNAFTMSAQLYSSKVTLVRQTFIPMVEKALIELLENSGTYDRSSFEVSASYQDNDFKVIVELHYQVDLWLGTEFEPEWIQHDQGYIFQTLSQISNIQIDSINIDTSKGDLQIIATF